MTESVIHEARMAVRRRHRALRDAMTAEECQALSRMICRRLTQEVWYASCQVIYGYYPLGREADCLAFLKQALADGKQVALPRMRGAGSAEMDFYAVASPDQVAEGAFHVMEPLLTCPPVRKETAVVLVPGVVFDPAGGRYGYGKGCYDRYFARFPGLFRVGIAYENQMEAHLPQLDTDVRMHEVITERLVYHCE